MLHLPAFLSRETYDDLSKITFSISNSFPLSSNILQMNITDFESILQIGDKFLQQKSNLTQSALRDSFLSSELLKLTSQFEKEKEDQQKEYLKSYEKEVQSLRKQISELQAELAAASKSDSIIREQERAASQRILDLMEKKNKELLEAKESALATREQTLIQKEAELQTKILRQASSSLRGQDGESFFENLAKEKKGWNLTDTSKIPHAADYQATIHNTLCLFEVKHYTHPVPSKEITKFLRDMKENPAAHFGAFLSLNTLIQTRDPTQLISFDWIHSNQCVVYFQKCTDLDMDTIFSVMDELIKITSMVNRLIQDSTTSQEPIYQTRIDRAKSGLQEIVVKLNESIRKIREDRQRVLNIVESQTESRIGELRAITSSVSRSLEILLGESMDVSEELPEPPPPQIKKKGVSKKKQTTLSQAPVLTINDETS